VFLALLQYSLERLSIEKLKGFGSGEDKLTNEREFQINNDIFVPYLQMGQDCVQGTMVGGPRVN
jgi:hypothetical protein